MDWNAIGRRLRQGNWAEGLVLLTALGFGAAGWTGCRGIRGHAVAAASPDKYTLRGVVVSSDPEHATVVLRHEAIPGLMSAMTMPYQVQDRSVAAELHPGDKLVATLDVQHEGDGTQKLDLRDIDILEQASPDYKPAAQYHVPAPGDAVPNFALLDQSDRTVDLKQYRGKVLVITFIYTRCPLSDYCPRMSHNFAKINGALQSDPGLYARTHLLSVSFDPEHDTPKVLRSYGGAYTGKYVNETFSHWTFAAPPLAELGKMEQYFDLGVTPGKDGTLQHSLATLVIGKDGRVAAFWPTNDWTVEQVMAAVQKAAAA